MEKKMKHLEMIQAIITRMASNSFKLKGWAVTLVSGIYALASKDVDKMYFLVAFIPIVVFWGLDSFYLLQERLYRTLYNKVCKLAEQEIDFSMNSNLPEYKDEKNRFLDCLFSKTEVGFYFPLTVLTAGIIIITHI